MSFVLVCETERKRKRTNHEFKFEIELNSLDFIVFTLPHPTYFRLAFHTNNIVYVLKFIKKMKKQQWQQKMVSIYFILSFFLFVKKKIWIHFGLHNLLQKNPFVLFNKKQQLCNELILFALFEIRCTSNEIGFICENFSQIR